MPSLVIYFTVTIVLILPINVDSKPPRDLDEVIMEYVSQPKNRGILKGFDYELDSDSDSEEDSHKDNGRLGREDIFNLLDIATFNENKDDDVTPKIRKEIHGKHKGFENSQPKEILANILERLISKGEGKEKPKRNGLRGRPKNRVEPNTRLPFKLNYDNEDNDNDLEKYSQIYIILNPSAVSTSIKKSLNDQVSKMSQYPAPAKEDRQRKRKLPRYKGFLVNKNVRSRRLRRESKEMYAPNSMEDKKRNRGGGGGGGGGGRTAIPYIRHRGDIYEREG